MTDRDADDRNRATGATDRATDDETNETTNEATDDGASETDEEAAERADTAVGEWEAVFWDVGGVVLDVASVQRGHRLFLRRLVDDHDLEVPVEEAVETWRTTVGEHFRERDGTEFRSARAGYARAVAAIVGEPLPEDEWLPLFREVLAETLEPNPGAIEAIAELSELDLHLGVVSDADRDELLYILEEFGVLEYFDSLTVSEDVGRTKPDPAMFEAALDAADVDPERALMIGDRYRHDVAGAARFGISTVAHGADDGEAVDYRVEDDLTEVLEIVRGERD